VRKLRFALIGAGMVGILSAIKLREAGHDFTVDDVAGRAVLRRQLHPFYARSTQHDPVHDVDRAKEPAAPS
jgi:hypothetical protein